MDEIYEWLNPRIPVEYVLISFLVLSVAIVIGMLVMKGGRAKRFMLGALLAEYYFLVLCSTVICRASHGERHIELIPFWNYLDIWNRVDYPADLIEVLLNMALFVPIGLLLGGIGFKTKKILLMGICLSGIIEVSQFAFCKGLCETDDVMHNSVGAFLGYLGFLGILKGKRRLFSKFSGSLSKKGFFSKTYPSFLILKEGFLKSSRPSLPLKKAPPLFSVFSPQGRRGKPPSGAQNRFALWLADHQRSAPCCAGWDRMGTAC